ncbi:hypothetical protein QYM36_005186 [Artemia franciscana]|uniref:Uncharacterized protein n=1 Tax=Artemia franciscana TaxID=6661 RepID=A0AA88L7C2_ARTSF|nr:hypothetical protein QYM36_005186 [Artemia franciscana]
MFRLLKDVSTRWLTIGPAASRLRKEIIWLIKQPIMKADCQFVVDSSNLFIRFTENFQQDVPLVHKLHAELNLLILTLAGRVLKPVATEKLRDELTLQPFEDEKNFLLLLQTVVSDVIVDCLESVDELP